MTLAVCAKQLEEAYFCLFPDRCVPAFCCLVLQPGCLVSIPTVRQRLATAVARFAFSTYQMAKGLCPFLWIQTLKMSFESVLAGDNSAVLCTGQWFGCLEDATHASDEVFPVMKIPNMGSLQTCTDNELSARLGF